jgi:hypothetical protein
MIRLRAEAQAVVFGTHSAWSLAWHRGYERVGTQCRVVLEIQGDEQNGYHLVLSPDGFSTSDGWFAELADARRSASELFGVEPDQWRDGGR